MYLGFTFSQIIPIKVYLELTFFQIIPSARTLLGINRENVNPRYTLLQGVSRIEIEIIPSKVYLGLKLKLYLSRCISD